MFKTIKIMRVTLMLSLAMSLAACGFHLRGTTDLFEGAQTVYVVAPKGSFAGATVTGASKGADMVVDVSSAKLDRTIGTLDDRGIVSSYQLRFTVAYSVFDSSSKLVRSPQVLTEDGHYVFNAEFVVESEEEERALRKSMENNVAQRVVRQLSTINVN